MAETAGMNFSALTSYSSPYTLWGLSRLLMPFYIRNFLHYAIIQTFGLRNSATFNVWLNVFLHIHM